MIEELIGLLIRNRGKLVGALLGFVVGWLLLTRGLMATLLLALCVGFGYYMGKKVDEEGDLRELFNRLLPPYRR